MRCVDVQLEICDEFTIIYGLSLNPLD